MEMPWQMDLIFFGGGSWLGDDRAAAAVAPDGNSVLLAEASGLLKITKQADNQLFLKRLVPQADADFNAGGGFAPLLQFLNNIWVDILSCAAGQALSPTHVRANTWPALIQGMLQVAGGSRSGNQPSNKVYTTEDVGVTWSVIRPKKYCVESLAASPVGIRVACAGFVACSTFWGPCGCAQDILVRG